MCLGIIGIIRGSYSDFWGIYWGYIEIMEKEMETTIIV